MTRITKREQELARATDQLRERLAQRLRAELAKLREDLAPVLDEPLWKPLDVDTPEGALRGRRPVRWASNATPGFRVESLFWTAPQAATVGEALALLEPHTERLAAGAANTAAAATLCFATGKELVAAMLTQEWLAARWAWTAWPCTDTPMDAPHPELWGERASDWELWCIFTMLRARAWPIRWERAAPAPSSPMERTERARADQDAALSAYFRESVYWLPDDVAPAHVTAWVEAVRKRKGQDDPTGATLWHEDEQHRWPAWIELRFPGGQSSTVQGHNVALLYLAEREARYCMAPGSYRILTALAPVHRAIGGKRHGKDHGILVDFDSTQERLMLSLRVEGPKGFTLDLFNGTPTARAKREDFDERGVIKPEAVWRMVREVTGPGVAMMGHVAFALAHRHAVAEGRRPDGRFWASPSEIADLLGYSRESNGTASVDRISKDAVRTVRENFAHYGNTIIRMKVQLPDGSDHKVEGPLLYPTKLEHSWREPGQKGRDKRVEWRIRDELWTLMERNHIWIPESLLNSGVTKPDTWAHCIRLYEVLATHARRNAKTAGSGEPLVLALETIMQDANLAGPKVQAWNARVKLMEHLKLLESRGAVSFEAVTLKDGRAGIRYTLSESRRAELAQVASRHRELADRSPRRGSPGRRKKP